MTRETAKFEVLKKDNKTTTTPKQKQTNKTKTKKTNNYKKRKKEKKKKKKSKKKAATTKRHWKRAGAVQKRLWNIRLWFWQCREQKQSTVASLLLRFPSLPSDRTPRRCFLSLSTKGPAQNVFLCRWKVLPKIYIFCQWKFLSETSFASFWGKPLFQATKVRQQLSGEKWPLMRWKMTTLIRFVLRCVECLVCLVFHWTYPQLRIFCIAVLN